MVAYEPMAVAPAAGRRREELGNFLKARRAQLTPADFGMPGGPRRRTPGLRREEVALLAGVGVTWYTWLEQGREINASTQVLDAVASTLRLDRAEREHMYMLAEATPLMTGALRGPVPQEVGEIVRSLDPLPATLTNGRFDILVSNAAHEDLFWEWHSMPCVHKNTLWCCVTEPTAREKFPQYDQEVRYLVARMRAAYARHVGDPGLGGGHPQAVRHEPRVRRPVVAARGGRPRAARPHLHPRDGRAADLHRDRAAGPGHARRAADGVHAGRRAHQGRPSADAPAQSRSQLRNQLRK